MEGAVQSVKAALEQIALDPQYHDLLTLVKGVRNGIVYGCKVRFPHALVMILLFRSGTLREKAILVLKATRTHARNLGLFALVYKSSMLLFRNRHIGRGKEGRYDSFLAGLIGGYTVFARSQSSVNQQIVIYVFARVVLALAKLALQARDAGVVEGGGGWELIPDRGLADMVRKGAWPVFASVSWAMVMYVFRWHPETVQPSVVNRYVQSDHWDSLRTLLWHNK